MNCHVDGAALAGGLWVTVGSDMPPWHHPRARRTWNKPAVDGCLKPGVTGVTNAESEFVEQMQSNGVRVDIAARDE